MISIIVCTYNRSQLLGECLDSILSIADLSKIKEIIVVDNNSTDQTKEVVLDYQNRSSLVSYVLEPKIGLSHARNAGVKSTSGKWLLFIDDDAKIRDESLLEVQKTITDFDFVMFTGIWKAWYRSPAPKWLPFDTGNYVVKGELGIREIGADYVSGGIMIINKAIFEKEVNQFPIELGMSGEKIGFGEESYVENVLRGKGFKVGINTNIIIDHLVHESKYVIGWHIKTAYKKGYANSHILNEKSVFSDIIKIGIAFIFGWIKPFGKLFLRRKYYIQNFTIDYIGRIQYHLGSLAQKSK